MSASDPSISTPYDHIAEDFGALRTALLPNEVRYLGLLLEPLEPGSQIVDLGCGTGTPVATFIAAKGHHLTGVDGSAEMLAMAQQTLPEHRWIHGYIDQVEFDAGEVFDAALCWDSLFHLPRAVHYTVLAKVHQWLRPGGRLMVSSGGSVDPGPEGFTDTMFGHEFYYDSVSPTEMTAMLEEIGFRIVLGEMCNQPDGDRDKGKWATVAEKQG
ncbi:MAG: class I SAM-dependent methyltransferase [Chthoniobacteraceae bacterium]